MPTKQVPNAIENISRCELKPGILGKYLVSGSKVIRLIDDARVTQLWNRLLDSQNDGINTLTKPWETDLANMARNHQAKNISLGDMLRFVPGHYGSIIRKFRIFPSPDKTEMQCIPNQFWSLNQRVSLSDDVLQLAWEVMSDLLNAMLPKNFDYPPYAVDIQLVKYMTSSEDLDRIFDLLADSGSIYTRFGHKLDEYRAMATGPFDLRYVRDIFGWGCTVPRINTWLFKINEKFKASSAKHVPENYRILGIPHLDGYKFFSALISERDVIRTEIYDDEKWVELPMSSDNIIIFPAKDNVNKQLGIKPTWHRVLLNNKSDETIPEKPNVTLLMGIVSLKDSLKLSFT